MPLVVTEVCRFTLNQSFLGNLVCNVLDMHINIDGSIGVTRQQAIEDQAEILAKQWSTDVMPDLVSALRLESVSWVDLDNATGSVGSFAGSAGAPLPHVGGVDNAPASSNVSILVRKQTSSARGSKQGRIFVCGLPEAYTTQANPNNIDGGFLATLQEDFDAFLGNINQDASAEPPAYDSELVVVHKVPIVGEGTGSDVSALRVDSRLATQRRRLRR